MNHGQKLKLGFYLWTFPPFINIPSYPQHGYNPLTVPYLKIKYLVQCSHQKLLKYYKNKSIAQNNMSFCL